MPTGKETEADRALIQALAERGYPGITARTLQAWRRLFPGMKPDSRGRGGSAYQLDALEVASAVAAALDELSSVHRRSMDKAVLALFWRGGKAAPSFEAYRDACARQCERDARSANTHSSDDKMRSDTYIREASAAIKTVVPEGVERRDAHVAKRVATPKTTAMPHRDGSTVRVPLKRTPAQIRKNEIQGFLSVVGGSDDDESNSEASNFLLNTAPEEMVRGVEEDGLMLALGALKIPDRMATLEVASDQELVDARDRLKVLLPGLEKANILYASLFGAGLPSFIPLFRLSAESSNPEDAHNAASQ